MAGWLKRTILGPEPRRLPEEPDAQNDWIKTSCIEWQTRWHDYFDSDHDLIADGEFDRPLQLPVEIDADYRLIFGLSRATRETRKNCFALFPEGKEMHLRFEHYLSSKPISIPAVDAHARLVRITNLIEEIGPNEDIDFSNVKIVNRDTDEGLGELERTDDITILLERSLLRPHPVAELPKIAAKHFLTEPLYASAGNYYHVRDWVTSAMTGGSTDELHSDLYRLWDSGWQVRLGQDGLVLAHRTI